jgi:hypothetical protein
MDVRAERKRLETALAAGNESVRIALGGVLQLYGEHAIAISSPVSRHCRRYRAPRSRLSRRSLAAAAGAPDAA